MYTSAYNPETVKENKILNKKIKATKKVSNSIVVFLCLKLYTHTKTFILMITIFEKTNECD